MEYLFVSLLMVASFSVAGQSKYVTKDGCVSISSKSVVEDISAKNTQVSSKLETESGKVSVAMLVKSFQFEKSMHAKRFNESMESNKFPKAYFTGSIVNCKSSVFKVGAVSKVKVFGELTIHGVTKPITVESVITRTREGITSEATFPIKLVDFGVNATPEEFVDNTVRVTVKINYLPLKK